MTRCSTVSTPTALETRAWEEHHTVIVFGQISRAAWWPPDGDLPGILIAPNSDQAIQLLDKIANL